MKRLVNVLCLRALMAATLSAGLPSLPSYAGSLYDEQNFRSPISDRKAYRPGDSLTVLVYENASATATADTTAEKSGGLNLSIRTPSIDKSTNVNLSDNFAGSGRIQRSGKVLAQITVTVVSVEPNGELNIKGDQLIEVNSETQAIKLEGRVRPTDILEGNTVASNRIANARISYVGDGVLGEKQTPGLLTRILSWLRLL